MSSWGIIGHDWAVELLQRAIKTDRVGHAYLITGPAQVGKTTLARQFAQALNCESSYLENRPCEACRACKLIASGRHPDVRLVEPSSDARGRQTLKIDQIRELQQYINLAPYEGRYKIAILTNFDAANPSAANAFLKTLEEPPEQVVLILTAAESDSMLPTIQSRCRALSLRPVPNLIVSQALESEWRLDSAKATLLAHLANGRLGWAVQATQNEAILQDRETHLTLLNDILTSDRIGRFAKADKLARTPETIPSLLHEWLSWWRDLTLLASGDGEEAAAINIDRYAQLSDIASKWDAALILTCLKQTSEALWQLERNANTRLVLENLFLTYPKL